MEPTSLVESYNSDNRNDERTRAPKEGGQQQSMNNNSSLSETATSINHPEDKIQNENNNVNTINNNAGSNKLTRQLTSFFRNKSIRKRITSKKQPLVKNNMNNKTHDGTNKKDGDDSSFSTSSFDYRRSGEYLAPPEFKNNEDVVCFSKSDFNRNSPSLEDSQGEKWKNRSSDHQQEQVYNWHRRQSFSSLYTINTLPVHQHNPSSSNEPNPASSNKFGSIFGPSETFKVQNLDHERQTSNLTSIYSNESDEEDELAIFQKSIQSTAFPQQQPLRKPVSKPLNYSPKTILENDVESSSASHDPLVTNTPETIDGWENNWQSWETKDKLKSLYLAIERGEKDNYDFQSLTPFEAFNAMLDRLDMVWYSRKRLMGT